MQITVIQKKIFEIRGQKVILDFHLAELYEVETKRLKEAVKRNMNRFPSDFMFELTDKELRNLRSQIATSSWGGGLRRHPFVFTEHGAVMLASVLNTEIAVEASLRVVRAFVRLRELLGENVELARKFAELETRLNSHDEAIASLFDAIRKLLQGHPGAEAKREIGFHVKNRTANQAVSKNMRV